MGKSTLTVGTRARGIARQVRGRFPHLFSLSPFEASWVFCWGFAPFAADLSLRLRRSVSAVGFVGASVFWVRCLLLCLVGGGSGRSMVSDLG